MENKEKRPSSGVDKTVLAGTVYNCSHFQYKAMDA